MILENMYKFENGEIIEMTDEDIEKTLNAETIKHIEKVRKEIKKRENKNV